MECGLTTNLDIERDIRPLVFIFHESADFVRDIGKRLRALNWVCVSLFDNNWLYQLRNQDTPFLVIVDVNMNDRYFRMLSKIKNTNYNMYDVFIVNAFDYVKSDWKKIDTYSKLLEIKFKGMIALNGDR